MTHGRQEAAATTGRGSRGGMLGLLVAGHAVKHIFNSGFFVILPELKAGLGLSNVDIGAISTARNVAGGLSNLPAGYVADRFSAQFPRVLMVTLVLLGLFLFAVGRSANLWQAMAATTLVGISITFWHPAAIGAISRVFADRRGFGISLHGTGGSIGEAIGPILTGTLLVALTWRGVLSWALLPAVAGGLVVGLALKGGGSSGGAVSLGAYSRAFVGLLRDRRLLALFLITGGFAAAQSAVMTFLPIYVRGDLGLPTWAVGGYLSLAQVVGIGTQPLLGYLSDRMGRKVVIVPSLLCMGLAILAMYAATSGLLFLASLAFLGGFVFSIMALLLAAASDLVGEEVQATIVAMMFAASVLFAGVSPYIAGLVADGFGTRAVFMYAGAVAVATSLLALATPWDRRG